VLETGPTRAVCLEKFSHQLQSERYSRKSPDKLVSPVDILEKAFGGIKRDGF
jgi:hypothetical protein